MSDVALTIGFLAWFLSGDPGLLVIGAALLILDIAHTSIATTMLLTGSFKDKDGRVIKP